MLAEEAITSSALQRSKTAPTPLVDSHGVSAAQLGEALVVGTIKASYVSGYRTKPGAFFHAKPDATIKGGALALAHGRGLDFALTAQTRGDPPLVSPRHDIRDNPFNLADFFPSRPGSPDHHPVEWARSPVAAEEGERTGENIDAEWRNALSARSLSMNALDEYAREVIAKESKLGILGLARVPSSFLKSIRENYFRPTKEEEEEHQEASTNVTPLEVYSTAIDEPFDDDTLCETMQSRRVAFSEREANTLPDRVPSIGLFSPATELEMEEVELGCATAMYSKLLGPEV
ncbi:hypothetical protein A7U60_g7328 [Sanghuangporus baumii]|uniref:Uncharacterized protein n=1 Tax=Sanghuangporus baumii TaxID=108892 RepID=A0A9Q5HTG1_SANBA|nr:hypothetical protein A7U60_g7328 [Sanghuangporus baumii]